MSSNPGKKFDAGKAPVERGFVDYFPKAILAVAAISAYGAKKYEVTYEDKNWERLDDARLRYKDGRGRHIVGEAADGPWDPESKRLHAAHAAWNAMAYLELTLREGVPLEQPEVAGFGSAKAVPRINEHFCSAYDTVKPGNVVECESCKTAIYGPREI